MGFFGGGSTLRGGGFIKTWVSDAVGLSVLNVTDDERLLLPIEFLAETLKVYFASKVKLNLFAIPT
jgi:hypothetical protein